MREPIKINQLRTWCRVLKSAHRLFDDFSKKSDREIGNLLLNEVWSDMDCFSRKADIVDEAIQRLKRKNANNISESDQKTEKD